MSTVTVVNRKDGVQTNDIYIGRGSPLGNPFAMRDSSDMERIRVINAYRTHIIEKISGEDKDIAMINELNRIINLVSSGNDVRLGCFCSPKACHGDIIKEIIELNV